MPLRIVGILTVNFTSSVMQAAKAMTKSLRGPADANAIDPETVTTADR